MPPSRYINAIATDFGKLVSRLRLERGWSKADLARHSRMNVVYLGHVERGDNVPTLTTLFRLADRFTCSGDQVMMSMDQVHLFRRSGEWGPWTASAPVE